MPKFFNKKYILFLILCCLLSNAYTQDKKVDSKLYLELGNTHYDKYQFVKSVFYFKKALTLSENPKDSAIALRDIGASYAGLNINQEALKYSTDGLILAERNKLVLLIPEILINLGQIKYTLNDYDGALESYLEALTILNKEKKESPTLKAFVLNNIGIAYSDQNKNDLAISYLNKSLLLKNKLSDNQIVRAYNNLASILNTAGKPNLALIELEKALLYCNNDSLHGVIYVYATFSEIYITKKEYSKALTYAHNSLKKAKEFNDDVAAYKVREILSNIYEKLGDHKQAVVYYKKHLTDYKNRFNEQSAQQKAFYEINKKENDIQLLKAEKLLNLKKITNKNRLLLVSLCFIIVLTVGAIIVLRAYKNIKRAHTDLVKVNLDIVLLEKNSNIAKTTKYNSSALDEDKKNRILTELNELFTTEKIFLKPDLTITEVADKIETNKRYLSQVINEKVNKNFNTYLNEARVNEARKLLTQKEYWNYTIESIAYKVGFNSKSSFNLAFKKTTGITPSFFLNTLKKG